ncbi:MAG: hypothetical protein ACRC6V_06820 [Bacteroidales bacterium]
MTKALDMKGVDWLKLYVNSEVDKFEKRFGYHIDQQEIEDVCKLVANLKLPEGVDTFYVMMCLTNTDDYVLNNYIDLAKIYNLTLGLDMLIYVYGEFIEANGYDEQVAFIFKNCIQYTIPF